MYRYTSTFPYLKMKKRASFGRIFFPKKENNCNILAYSYLRISFDRKLAYWKTFEKNRTVLLSVEKCKKKKKYVFTLTDLRMTKNLKKKSN